jgi:hypothetical protein
MKEQPMHKLLVLNPKANKYLTQYKAMCAAITACHRIDECKEVIDKSVAMAAYYAQINDTETEKMFNRIRVRAWRRLGEMLTANMTFEDCDSYAARVRKVKAVFPKDPVVSDIGNTRMTELLKLMEVSDHEFEYAIKKQINGSLVDFLRHTPTHEKMLNEATKRRDAEYARQRVQWDKEAKEQAGTIHLKLAHDAELQRSAEDAMKDIGITLERKDRANMKQVVFLIKEEVHATMRQAAFDKHVTMQEVLRRGLKLWLEANGYNFPDDDGPVRGHREKREEARP